MSLKSKNKENVYIFNRLKLFINKNKRIPKYFIPYDASEVTDYACTLSTECGTPGHMSNILIFEVENNEKQ